MKYIKKKYLSVLGFFFLCKRKHKLCRGTIEHKLCMNNKLSDTSLCEPLLIILMVKRILNIANWYTFYGHVFYSYVDDIVRVCPVSRFHGTTRYPTGDRCYHSRINIIFEACIVTSRFV
jgi:hypothetical protein